MKIHFFRVRRRYLALAGAQIAVVAVIVGFFTYDGPSTFDSCEELAETLVGHDLLRGNLRATISYNTVSYQAPLGEFLERAPAPPDSPNRISAVAVDREVNSYSPAKGRYRPYCRGEFIVQGKAYLMDFSVYRYGYGPEELWVRRSPR